MRILITAGPTREYLDDVRFLSNASSGKMGFALAAAAVQRGHTVELVAGPVDLAAPPGCIVHRVITTREMYDRCRQLFPACDGVIGTAAVCDYRPRFPVTGKLKKTGQPLQLELVETEDILAALGGQKEAQWIVGFALEADQGRDNALRKLRAKQCDAIVLNAPQAIGAETNSVQLIGPRGEVLAAWADTKAAIAEQLLDWIEQHLGSPGTGCAG